MSDSSCNVWIRALMMFLLLAVVCSFEGSDSSTSLQARSLAAVQNNTTITLGPGAKWSSYPFCGLTTENDEKCTKLLNSQFIPQQWSAVGRAFGYINDNKDYGLGCQTPGKCKVITNPFTATSKASKAFKPLEIVKLTKPVTVQAGASFQATSQLQIVGAKIGLKAAWTFSSNSYVDVKSGGQLNINGGSLQGRVALFQVINSTLLVGKKASSVAGPAVFSGSTVTQNSASFALVDAKPVSNSPNIVSIVKTTWNVKSSSKLIFDSRSVYVSTTRLTLDNSELVLRNTTMQIFESSLFLKSARITLDKSSSISLYNYRIVGDTMVAATDIIDVKKLVGQQLSSSDDYTISGPGYITIKSL